MPPRSTGLSPIASTPQPCWSGSSLALRPSLSMRLLLDAHVAIAIAAQLQREGIDVVALRDWQGGGYRNASDDLILVAALAEQCVLITFDCRTIPPLLK